MKALVRHRQAVCAAHTRLCVSETQPLVVRIALKRSRWSFPVSLDRRMIYVPAKHASRTVQSGNEFQLFQESGFITKAQNPVRPTPVIRHTAACTLPAGGAAAEKSTESSPGGRVRRLFVSVDVETDLHFWPSAGTCPTGTGRTRERRRFILQLKVLIHHPTPASSTRASSLRFVMSSCALVVEVFSSSLVLHVRKVPVNEMLNKVNE